MGIYARIRNGIRIDPLTGLGGATEGDIRGNSSDLFEQSGGVPNIEDGHLLVHESGVPGMSVVIDPGVGYIPNEDYDPFDSDSIKFWEVVLDDEETHTLSIAANPTGDTRVDLICLFLDVTILSDSEGSNVASKVVVQGIAGTGAPALPANHLLLAQVNVPSGTPNIEDEDIVDAREQMTIKAPFLPTHLEGTRIDKRVRTITTATTLEIDVDVEDEVYITDLASSLTIDEPAGTPTPGQVIFFYILDNGIARSLTFDAIFVEVGVALPTDTEPGLILNIGAKWDHVNSKWNVLMVAQQ